MEATAMVETAFAGGFHSDGGHIQKDEPSNPKRGNLSSSGGYDEAKLIYRDSDWDSFTLEQRVNDTEISNVDKIDLLAPSSTAGTDSNLESTRSRPRDFEDSIECAFLNETYTIHYATLNPKSKSLIPLNSELHSEMQIKEEVLFDILEHKVSKSISLGRGCKLSDDYKGTAEDTRVHAAGEDSQQEYHSAEEEQQSELFPCDQAETSQVPDPDAVGLDKSIGHGSSVEVRPVNLENNSTISLDSVDIYGQEDSPHVSKFQNSVMLKEYHKPKHEKCKEQETSSTYHTVFDEIVLRNSPENQESESISGFLNSQQALKTKIHTSKIKSQVTETKNFCGNSTVENKMLQQLENLSTLPQDRALETLLDHCKDCQTSCTSVYNDSEIFDCEHSHYKSLPNTLNSALDFSVTPPRLEVKDNQAIEEDLSLKVSNGSAAHEMCFHSIEGAPELMTKAAQRTVTVNQTVDVSTDFRACFTTSRATSARSCVVSTSSNTEITMMSKKRPGEWQRGNQRTVACNTDWSHSQDCEDTQWGVTKGSLGNCSVNSLRPNQNFLNKDSPELGKTLDTTHLKDHPDRGSQLSKETKRNLPSKCCQKMMQRAIRAELHLLNVHYQLCRCHCSDLYRLVAESKEELSGNLSTNSTNKEFGSALLSVLGDLKVKYVSLKEKINKGLPLEELPPLSVESKLLSTFSTFASRLMKKEAHLSSGADSKLDNESTHDVGASSSLEKTLSQMSLVSNSGCPEQGRFPKDSGLKNDDIDGHFSQLKLDDKDYKNYQEISEDWFDARENLTGSDCLGIQESQTEPEGQDPKFTFEVKGVEPLQRDKGYLVHVGGLCPSVSEADLRSHFQKYQVSEISIYDSSNYRYASLAFKRNSDAKSAVKEMIGTEINGKSVNVRLVKTPGECTSPLSKNGRRVNLNNLKKSTNKDINSASCISRLPRTRPRQLGSEQDSEFFHCNQGVKKNCKQIESTKVFPDPPIQFMPANTLNLRSFTKIMKRLVELHPDISRDHLIDALQEVKVNHKGFLHGLSINAIVDMTSSVLKNSPSS